MKKSIKKLIFLATAIMAVIGIIVIITTDIIFHNKATDVVLEKQEKAVTPDLIKQLYNISIPDELDPEAKSFTNLKDGQVEVRGPQILKDGNVDKSGPQDLLYWGVYLNDESNYYAIADFNNDGLNDVAIVMEETGGGSGLFYHLVIFINEGGRLKYLTSEYLGDRIKVNKIDYDSGVITANIITQGPNEGYCCGTTPATLKFKLENNHLVLIK